MTPLVFDWDFAVYIDVLKDGQDHVRCDFCLEDLESLMHSNNPLHGIKLSSLNVSDDLCCCS